MKKKILLFVSALFLGLNLLNLTVAATKSANDVDVYLFVGATCPHCKRLEQDITKYAKDKSYLKLHFYEIYNNKANQKLINKVAEKLKTEVSGVPFVIIGDKPNVGYGGNIKAQFGSQIEKCHIDGCKNSIKTIVKSGQEWELFSTQQPRPKPIKTQKNSKSVKNQNRSKLITKDLKHADSDLINLPFGIKLNKRTTSLPIMTVVIGLLDGFNPCAMWALVFVITLLIGLKDRQKMWSYGLAFIATSAIVYTLFMVAWLNVFKIIGIVTPIRIIIGLVAIAIGIYYLREYCKKDNLCKISNNEKRLAYFQKMKQSVESSNFWLGLVGVAVLAVAVNMVELVCSAGLPAVYTNILASANLSSIQYMFYIGLYILFFMLDDLVVFAIAVKTMSIVNIDSKYSKISRLVGGILMTILGILLIFAPNLIMFG